MRKVIWTLSLLILALVADPALAGWNLVLSAEVTVQNDIVRLREITSVPVPDAVGDLVVATAGRPGQSVSVTRRGLLRELVSCGQAAGVRMSGADICRINFAGGRVSAEKLNEEVRRVLQPLVPTPTAGAPASWFELDLPDRAINAAGTWEIRSVQNKVMEPGRNIVQLELVDGGHRVVFNANVTLHCFQEVGHVREDIQRDEALSEALFAWAWRDLADETSGLALGRHAVVGRSAARDMKAGKAVRQADLKSTPMIDAGQPVELQVIRGTVAVTVRAFARQAGCLGQVIPVRNELTGQLVNAKIAGPGLVEWRR